MTVSDTIYDKGYGIALRHGSQHRDLFSLGILVLQEKGTIEQLERKWWPEVSSKCAMHTLLITNCYHVKISGLTLMTGNRKVNFLVYLLSTNLDKLLI